MSKKPPKRPRDPNQLGKLIVGIATGENCDNYGKDSPDPDKNPHAVALGRLGGKKGGTARAQKLTPERRKEIAQKAAKTRWKTKKD